MKLAWCTDTHLDHLKRNQIWRFGDKIRHAKVDGLLITGDVSDAANIHGNLHDVRSRIGKNTPVYVIAGNHDWWTSGFAAHREQLKVIANNIPLYLGNREWVDIGGGHAALIGVDGWYDGRAGIIERSRIYMRDWDMIDELKFIGDSQGIASPLMRRQVFAELGRRSAEELETKLTSAVRDGYRHIIVATHFPPFRESSLYKGQVCDNDSAPYYVNVSLGDTLYAFAVEHPEVSITVLCGHSHERAKVQPADNLVVYTGRADYGHPCIAGIVETSSAGITVTEAS